MRVVFSGPAYSGKSTAIRYVAEELRRRGYRVKVFEELARDIIINEKLRGMPLQRRLYKAYLERYTKMKDADIYLLDRDLPDVFLYTLLYTHVPETLELAKEIMKMIARMHGDVYFIFKPRKGWEGRGRLMEEMPLEIREFEYMSWIRWHRSLIKDAVVLEANSDDLENLVDLIEIYWRVYGKVK